MKAFQIVIVLVCAGLGFGIVNSLINTARQSRHVDGAKHDRDPPDTP